MVEKQSLRKSAQVTGKRKMQGGVRQVRVRVSDSMHTTKKL